MAALTKKEVQAMFATAKALVDKRVKSDRFNREGVVTNVWFNECEMITASVKFDGVAEEEIYWNDSILYEVTEI